MEDHADSGGGGTAALAGPSVVVTEVRCPAASRPLRLLEWKVKPGSLVNVDSVLALCAPVPPEREDGPDVRQRPIRPSEKKVKSDRAGVVRELCCQLGQLIPPGSVLVRIEECSHPIVMKGLCAECGQDLTQLQNKNGKPQVPISTATVSMVHSVPELMVSSEQAEQLGREDQQRLHRNRKLVLMVDLDQTLIHTTEQHYQRMSSKGVLHFQLGRGEPMLHTRLRPHCREFLEKIARLYELHVFTFGSRLYAHTIAGFLDPEKKLFSHRILSRDECIDPFSKTGNLRNLFPCGDSMVCIIDDREDVWKFAPNLITVKKYTYFQGTGDINAPPGSRDAQPKRANHVGRPTEGAELTPLANKEEKSNGVRKRCRERPTGRGPAEPEDRAAGDNASGSQEIVGERTPVAEEGAGLAAGASQRGDAADATQPADSMGVSPAIPARGKGVTERTSNDLDFELSSDSESEPGLGNPSPSGSEDEGVQGGEKDTSAGGVNLAAEDFGQGDAGLSLVPPQQEGLQDLDNGCPDRKEAETESQNSEQSGVTVGEEQEEDQSAEEDEETEEPDLDQDDHLIYLEEVLTRIHSEYYARYEAFLKQGSEEMPDIRKIVPELKSKSLAGTAIAFSGLYPTNYPMERTRECYHAKALGARIHKNLVLNPKDVNQTTHLIAARAGTEKVRQAQGYRHLHVVNPDWLWTCLERWERVEEQLFPLKDDYTRAQRSSSPAPFPDLQGRIHLASLQSAPPQPKPAPAPELRTYDPVTGKLIRRGLQASRPLSFQNTSAAPLPLHMAQSSFRPAHPPAQQDRAPPSQDDEQPGPSRRKREPSMSETMPLYTLCKEDLESMDKEVDDILGEESDNESEGERKEEKMEEDEEEEEAAVAVSGHDGEEDLAKLLSTPMEAATELHPGDGKAPRGQKRKLDDNDDGDGNQDDGADSSSESSKESNEDEEGSSSEADEMAAALEAELNDFM
ncbi:RNA polymerase II subunit A C-terminal domain phosphatase [Brienomyrus brachyistius]|uniref:RNA polymerase II subunit A C-terminal domain phosphatase n=1 Tax=Brienomyrus brachyistius TaxID=42636 RepID=UPI0020B1B5D0|nr:RNA polymerase II subunit A C-terminal domain phosphatase [Brienomyrus brachyistius]